MCGIPRKLLGIILKSVELALSFVVLVLFADLGANKSRIFIYENTFIEDSTGPYGKLICAYTGFAAYPYVLLAILICIILNNDPGRLMNILMCLLFAVFSIAAAGFLFDAASEFLCTDFQKKVNPQACDQGTATGALAVLNAIFFIIDIIIDILGIVFSPSSFSSSATASSSYTYT